MPGDLAEITKKVHECARRLVSLINENHTNYYKVFPWPEDVELKNLKVEENKLYLQIAKANPPSIRYAIKSRQGSIIAVNVDLGQFFNADEQETFQKLNHQDKIQKIESIKRKLLSPLADKGHIFPPLLSRIFKEVSRESSSDSPRGTLSYLSSYLDPREYRNPKEERKKAFENLFVALENSVDATADLTAVVAFIIHGDWNIDSANTLFLLKLIAAAGYQLTKDEEERLFYRVIQPQTLTSSLIDFLQRAIAQKRNSGIEEYAKDAAREAANKIIALNLPKVLLVDEEANVEKLREAHPDNLILRLKSIKQERGFSWQLSYLDLSGQEQYMPLPTDTESIFFKFLQNLANGKIPNPAHQSQLKKYEELKTLCYQALDATRTIYLFNNLEKAQSFAKEHPELFCFYLKKAGNEWLFYNFDSQAKLGELQPPPGLKEQLDGLKGDFPQPQEALHHRLKQSLVPYSKELLAQVKVELPINGFKFYLLPQLPEDLTLYRNSHILLEASDDLYYIDATSGKLEEHFSSYDIGLIKNLAPNARLESNKFYLQNLKEGLSYRILGADGLEKTGIIAWKNLPNDFPRHVKLEERLLQLDYKHYKVLWDFAIKEGYVVVKEYHLLRLKLRELQAIKTKEGPCYYKLSSAEFREWVVEKRSKKRANLGLPLQGSLTACFVLDKKKGALNLIWHDSLGAAQTVPLKAYPKLQAWLLTEPNLSDSGAITRLKSYLRQVNLKRELNQETCQALENLLKNRLEKEKQARLEAQKRLKEEVLNLPKVSQENRAVIEAFFRQRFSNPEAKQALKEGKPSTDLLEDKILNDSSEIKLPRIKPQTFILDDERYKDVIKKLDPKKKENLPGDKIVSSELSNLTLSTEPSLDREANTEARMPPPPPPLPPRTHERNADFARLFQAKKPLEEEKQGQALSPEHKMSYT